jgi:hypothetical protein
MFAIVTEVGAVPWMPRPAVLPRARRSNRGSRHWVDVLIM